MIDVKLVGYLLVITILFTVYIEYSVGNIIWREGAKGIKESWILKTINDIIKWHYVGIV